MEKTKPENQWQNCTILIQCFNEEDTIENCIKKVNEAVPKAEILVIVGGTDNTTSKAQSLQKDIHNLRVIENRPDYGKGHATKVGIMEAKNDFQAEIDADLQFDPFDLPKILFPIINDGYQLVSGSRHMSNENWNPKAKNFARDYGNKFLAMLITILTGHKITDSTCGLHAWNRNFMKKIWFNDDHFLYPVEFTIRAIATKEKILEVPISYSNRTSGKPMHEGTYRVFRAGLKYILGIITTWHDVSIKKNLLAKSYPNLHSQKNK